MFAFTSLVALAAILAAATALPQSGSSTCSTGAIQCCNSVQSATDPGIATILGSIGIVAQDVDGLVGVTCSPITAVGVGSGDACDAQTVCCQDNAFGGVVSLGCAPITL